MVDQVTVANIKNYTGQVILSIFLTVFTGVGGFLGWNFWQMSISIEKLALEMQHVVKNEDRHNNQFKVLSQELNVIRNEQVSRTRSVYNMAKLEQRLSIIESDLSSRTNVRWNLADQHYWVNETKKINPDWNPAQIKNNN